MKSKLKEYIDTIFADAERRAPDNSRVRELKEEMLLNLNDRYDDLIAKGKSPAAAYNIAVAGVGDVSELLDSVVGAQNSSDSQNGTATAETIPFRSGKRPLTAEEQEIVRRYKTRSAIITSVSVAMYILCWLPLAILDEFLGTLGSAIGLAVMFAMIAVATCLIIYSSMTKPKFGANVENWDKDDDDDDDDDDGEEEEDEKPAKSARRRRSPVYKAISGALFAVTLCGYLLVSFATGAWHITWMIFLMYTALDNIIKAIFDLRR